MAGLTGEMSDFPLSTPTVATYAVLIRKVINAKENRHATGKI